MNETIKPEILEEKLRTTISRKACALEVKAPAERAYKITLINIIGLFFTYVVTGFNYLAGLVLVLVLIGLNAWELRNHKNKMLYFKEEYGI